MKYHLFLISFLVAMQLPWTSMLAAPIPCKGTVEVLFSPSGGATDAIIREIRAARKEILVQAYTLTAARIVEALAQAKKRGAKVEVLLDFERAEVDSSALQLDSNGIPVRVDAQHARNHDKVMLIDRETIITGSFDFTREAEESSSENLLILKANPTLAAKYLENYNVHREHSKPYVRYSIK